MLFKSIVKTVRDFCSSQHMQLLPWPSRLPDMSPISHVWNLVGRGLSRDPRPAASKNELWLLIQAIWNSLQQADVENLFDSIATSYSSVYCSTCGWAKY